MSDSTTEEPSPDPIASVEAWRTQAAATPDPVMSGIIESLARRAAAQQGEVRRLLTRRVEALLARHAASQPPAPRTAAAPELHTTRQASLAALSELVDQLGRSPGSTMLAPSLPRSGPAHQAGTPAKAPLSQVVSPKPLKAVAAFSGTWSRLRADQRLRQALAQVPAMAGPMNSAHVVNRALRAMRDLSPGYLDAFIAHIDTLLWLEQSSGAGDLAPRTANTAESRRRTGARPGRKG
jgi:hypothetical protein